MKRIAVILLIFCLLLCAACTPEPTVPDVPDEPPQTQDTPPAGDPDTEPEPEPEPVPEPEPEPVPEPEPEPLVKDLPQRRPVYLYSGDRDVAVDRDGNILLESEAGSLSVLQDSCTGEPVCIQRSCHEGTVTDQWGWTEAARSWCELYDLAGNLLVEVDAPYVTVSGSLLSYYSEKSNTYTALRLSDGSVVAENLHMAWLLDDVVVTKAIQWETPSTVLDADGKMLWQQPEGWYISGYFQDDDRFYLPVVDPDGRTGLLDTRGNTLLPCLYEQVGTVTGGRATVLDADGWHLIDLSTGETLLDWPYYIANVLENSAVVQSSSNFGRNILVDFAGNQLSAHVFQWLNLLDDDFDGVPELLYGNLDYSQTTLPEGVSVTQQTTVFLKPDGTEIYRVEYTHDQLEPVNSTTILRRSYGGSSDEVSYTMLDLTTQTEIPLPDRKYVYAEQLWYYTSRPQPEERQFFTALYINQLGHYHTCVLDAAGQILLDDLKACQYLGGGVFQVTQGFESGLMDLNGSWLYRQSRFSGLSD